MFLMYICVVLWVVGSGVSWVTGGDVQSLLTTAVDIVQFHLEVAQILSLYFDFASRIGRRGRL